MVWKKRSLGQRATDYLATLAVGAAQVDLVENDKYGGRILGNVKVKSVDLVSAMLAAGHGRPYAGGKRRLWCTRPGSELSFGGPFVAVKR